MAKTPPPVWEQRGAYLPVLFLAMLMPWGAFVVVMLAQAWDLVQPLFLTYLIIAAGVAYIAAQLLRGRASRPLFRFSLAVAGFAALPVFVSVFTAVTMLEGR